MPLYFPPTTIVGNAANQTVTAQGGTLNWYAGNNVTLSAATDAAGTSLSIHAPSGGGVNRSAFQINDGPLTTVLNLSSSAYTRRAIFTPFWSEGNNLQGNTLRIYASKASGSFVASVSLGLYRYLSGSVLTLQASSNYSFSHTNSTAFNGVRAIEFTGFSSVTLTEGRWVLAQLWGSGTASQNLQLYGLAQFPAAYVGSVLNTNTSAAATNGPQLEPWCGVYSTTIAALPSSVNKSEIHGGTPAVSAQIYAIWEMID